MKVTMKEILDRIAEIEIELEDENADVDKLTKEVENLKEEKRKLEERDEKRSKLLSSIAQGRGNVIKEFGKQEKNSEDDKETRNLFRNAFLKNLLGEELTEAEKRAYTHTTQNSGEVIPKELQDKIYTNMEEQHPLLKDVQVLRTGTVISIVKHTKIVAGDAKVVNENEANEDEQNTFVNVSLAGKDFSKHIEFSYALGKMAIPAFEQYLISEISNRLGAAMAKDIYDQIVKDTNTTNKFNAATPGTLALKDITKAFGLLKTSQNTNVYTTNATLWNAIANVEGAEGRHAFVPNFSDDIAGQLMGKPIKQEDAIGKDVVLILAPSEFIYNVVQDIMIEKDKDIKRHVNIISGYARAEGSLSNDLAAVVLTVGSAG